MDFNLTDYIPENGVLMDVPASSDKKIIIGSMVSVLVSAGALNGDCRDKIVSDIMYRESIGSTGIGNGIAVPHAKNDMVGEMLCAVGRSEDGIEFDAIDGGKVYAVFLLVMPKSVSKLHLNALSCICRMGKAGMSGMIVSSKDESDVIKVVKDLSQTE